MDFSSLRVLERWRSIRARRLAHFRPRIAIILAILALVIAPAFSKSPGEEWADKTIKSLTLREKIAQLVLIRVPGKFVNRKGSEFRAMREQIRQNHVGGVILFAGNVYESAILLNELQRISRLPLLVAADFERGASFRIADATSFPWTMALGAAGSEQFAYQQGVITAQESRALGVHWIFAPVMDVNNNPDNPVINIRSFGEDPRLVARLGSAFIRGAKKAGVLTTAKHFPGHGDTTTDSHISLPVVESDIARLQSIEYVPFRSAIEAGVDSIMTAHVAVPKVIQAADVPATLSSKILTDQLRNELKFKGLVVTDALEMAGITNRYWCGLAAVRAIQAGSDVLLLPPDASIAINEVERAVRRGDISETRIEQSVRKILAAKGSLGLHRDRLVSINRISEVVASPQSAALAQEIADHSITAVKDEQHLLPINPANDTRVFSLVLASDLESSPGAVFQAEMRRRFPSIRTAWGNARTTDELSATIDAAISESDLIVCSTLVRLSTGSGPVSLPESQRGIIERLMAARRPVVWVAFGNPYVLRLIPGIGTCLCTFSYSDVSQVAAAKALAGEIEISGRMPVAIPEYSKAGDGLRIPRLEMILKPAPPEAFGFTADAFENTGRLLTSFIESGMFPGAGLTVGYQGRIALEFATGRTGSSGGSAAVSPGTVYDLASLSRLVGTTSAAMLTAESGSLIFEAPVKDYLPEFNGANSEKVRVRDLWEAFSNAGHADAKSIEDSSALFQRIVSRASGLSFSRFLERRLFAPLGMKCAFYDPAAVTLSCNARDLAIFAQMLLNRGVYNHRRYFDPETIARWTQSPGPWSKPSDSDWTGKLLSSSAFGHSSSGGSMLWIDPGKKLFIVLLTNGTTAEAGKIDEAQRLIVESILAAVSRQPSVGSY